METAKKSLKELAKVLEGQLALSFEDRLQEYFDTCQRKKEEPSQRILERIFSEFVHSLPKTNHTLKDDLAAFNLVFILELFKQQKPPANARFFLDKAFHSYAKAYPHQSKEDLNELASKKISKKDMGAFLTDRMLLLKTRAQLEKVKSFNENAPQDVWEKFLDWEQFEEQNMPDLFTTQQRENVLELKKSYAFFCKEVYQGKDYRPLKYRPQTQGTKDMLYNRLLELDTILFPLKGARQKITDRIKEQAEKHQQNINKLQMDLKRVRHDLQKKQEQELQIQKLQRQEQLLFEGMERKQVHLPSKQGKEGFLESTFALETILEDNFSSESTLTWRPPRFYKIAQQLAKQEEASVGLKKHAYEFSQQAGRAKSLVLKQATEIQARDFSRNN